MAVESFPDARVAFSFLGTRNAKGIKIQTPMPCMSAVIQKVLPKPIESTRMPPNSADPDQPKMRTPSMLFHLALVSCSATQENCTTEVS